MANASKIAAIGFDSLPIIKQVGILVGLAASIALGVYMVQWSKEPLFAPSDDKVYRHPTFYDIPDDVEHM